MRVHDHATAPAAACWTTCDGRSRRPQPPGGKTVSARGGAVCLGVNWTDYDCSAGRVRKKRKKGRATDAETRGAGAEPEHAAMPAVIGALEEEHSC